MELELADLDAQLAHAQQARLERAVEDEEVAREHRLAVVYLLRLDRALPRVVRLPALVALKEGDLHHVLKESALRLPLFERRKLGALLLAAPRAVRDARLGDGVVVVRVHLGERDDLEVVRVPRGAVGVGDVHVRELMVAQLRPQHLDEPERVAALVALVGLRRRRLRLALRVRRAALRGCRRDGAAGGRRRGGIAGGVVHHQMVRAPRQLRVRQRPRRRERRVVQRSAAAA